jgi:uncharacterized protein (DUF2236 family)
VALLDERIQRRQPDRAPNLTVLEGGLAEATGWFSDTSTIRRIGSESLCLLGGGRAVLLQLAHPLVAAGVEQYSGFQADPLARLQRTMDLMNLVVFGDRREAGEALRRFHAVHGRIRGQITGDAGRFQAGTTYRADDPALKLWVLATLVDTSLLSYERFVRPLTGREREAFYAESYLLARLMGIPPSILPGTLDDLERYVAEMLSGDDLAVSETCRLLADAVLHPRTNPTASACATLLRFVTAGLLPERLRDEFGLPWDEQRQRALDALSATTRRLRPYAPAWLWQSPSIRPHGVLALLLRSARSQTSTSRP